MYIYIYIYSCRTLCVFPIDAAVGATSLYCSLIVFALSCGPHYLFEPMLIILATIGETFSL